jgi:hypothetical protein
MSDLIIRAAVRVLFIITSCEKALANSKTHLPRGLRLADSLPKEGGQICVEAAEHLYHVTALEHHPARS